MATDAHCHPSDLFKVFPFTQAERTVACAASAWNMEDFLFNEKLSVKTETPENPPVILCFAAHPQVPAYLKEKFPAYLPVFTENIERLAKENRLHAIGETGFDLYDKIFQDTEEIQDELFAIHLEIALKYDLPMVLHVRKAMHKVFIHSKQLKKLPSVIFHSYPGTVVEGESLLKRGINAYFSFGNPLRSGRKESLRACAALPLDRILTESDAPYQNMPDTSYSQWGDLNEILKTLSQLRNDFSEKRLDCNFYRAYRSR
jgi:TatD DNase family protein